MSNENESKKSNIVIVTIKMPDGKEHEVPLPAKIYKTGREGYFSQIPSFVFDGEVFGGQIQIWKKTPKSNTEE